MLTDAQGQELRPVWSCWAIALRETDKTYLIFMCVGAYAPLVCQRELLKMSHTTSMFMCWCKWSNGLGVLKVYNSRLHFRTNEIKDERTPSPWVHRVTRSRRPTHSNSSRAFTLSSQQHTELKGDDRVLWGREEQTSHKHNSLREKAETSEERQQRRIFSWLSCQVKSIMQSTNQILYIWENSFF